MKRIVDVQGLRILEVDDASSPARRLKIEVLIVGGGLGGVAAAIAATQAGRSVCLTEETDWLGGQATSQGVCALDENRWIETSGGTRDYQAFRKDIRAWYRQNARLKPETAADPSLNPGKGWVSRLCFEPMAALHAIDAMLAPATASGRLQVLRRHKAYAVHMSGTRIVHVDFVNLDSAERVRVSPAMVIEASELGDLLALGAAEFVVGAESKRRTNEPNALDVDDPEDVQSFTYPFVIENSPGGQHVIASPPDYQRNREQQPYTLVLHYKTRGDIRYGIFERKEKTYGSFWHYRRIIDASQFDDPAYPHDLSMINWPGNDYRGGSILVDSPDAQLAELRAAKDLSLGLLYWLQTEVDRDEGGRGYPEFKLRPDVLGAPDGLSKFPYIRESRRIVAVRTMLEREVMAEMNEGPRAAHFHDSIAIGLYAIDLHESKRRREQMIDPVKPFQIPLGALIPQFTSNLLAACKSFGTTHLTNGCTRLHPIEWAVGEAAGVTAAMVLEHRRPPLALRDDLQSLREIQRRLVRRGAPIMWYEDVGPAAERFESVQMLPFERPDLLERIRGDMKAPKL